MIHIEAMHCKFVFHYQCALANDYARNSRKVIASNVLSTKNATTINMLSPQLEENVGNHWRPNLGKFSKLRFDRFVISQGRIGSCSCIVGIVLYVVTFENIGS